jgi:HEAT repeat protein
MTRVGVGNFGKNNRAFGENDDARVRSIIAWALGRIGGREARRALEDLSTDDEGVQEEIRPALESCCDPATRPCRKK